MMEPIQFLCKKKACKLRNNFCKIKWNISWTAGGIAAANIYRISFSVIDTSHSVSFWV